MDSQNVGFMLGVVRRAGRATSVASISSSESEEEDDDDDDEEEEKEPLRAEKIVARNKLLPSEWREVCKDMNTAEVCVSSLFWCCVYSIVIIYVWVIEDWSHALPIYVKNEG